ncbi:hypothetical protein ABDD95_23550 [Mucilaginibacter sp. PAMB04274]|uniref:hypothetical protein n=1 Tax=Mucilaginibacter sp. PAMB04274 TaxID=3138568 RepID=UPI0031F5FB0B
MKKLVYTLLFGTFILTACQQSTSKTGGDVADSGMAGSSGPADTGMKSGTPMGTATGGSDTSTTASKDGVANPTVDTTGKTKPQ